MDVHYRESVARSAVCSSISEAHEQLKKWAAESAEKARSLQERSRSSRLVINFTDYIATIAEEAGGRALLKFGPHGAVAAPWSFPPAVQEHGERAFRNRGCRTLFVLTKPVSGPVTATEYFWNGKAGAAAVFRQVATS